MKLSAAIMKGSKGKHQIVEELFDGNGYCALGAACLGVGITPRKGSVFSRKLLVYFPYLGRFTGNYKTLANKIVKRNDEDGWSFKHIAGWLKRVGH